jgi:hypothetical protein
MPTTLRLVPAAAAVAAFAIACAPPSDSAGAPYARTASLFVTLDTLGDREAADTLVTPCNDDPSNEEMTPVTGVSIGAPVRLPSSDTTTVTVIYKALGSAHPEDAKVVGPRYWRFTSAPRRDTVLLRMAPDSAGRIWIACGPFHPDHASLAQMTEALGAMDSASLAAVEMAKQGKASPPTDSK